MYRDGRARPNAKLVINVLNVSLRSSLTNHKYSGNLTICETLPQELMYIALSRRKRKNVHSLPARIPERRDEVLVTYPMHELTQPGVRETKQYRQQRRSRPVSND